MKKIRNIIFLILLAQVNLLAQDQQAIQVESNQIVDISADQSWDLVQDWGKLNQLVPEVVQSTTVTGMGLDASWKIILTNGKTITEEMVYYNPNERTMAYIMTETPMPIENYYAVIKVEPYGISKSMISFFTSCQTSKENWQNITTTFKSFQETYLTTIKNQRQ